MTLTQVRPAGLSAGAVLQVQYTQLTSTSTQNISSRTDTVLDNLNVSITPVSTSSIIKLEAIISFEPSATNSEYNNVFFFYRDSTKLAPPAAGSRPVGIVNSATSFTAANTSSTPSMAHLTWYDSPSSTSAISYKVGAWFYDAITFYLNRVVTDSNEVDKERLASIVSATEIAG